MLSQDDVCRAQARAVIQVLADYELDQIAHVKFNHCYSSFRAYGFGGSDGSDRSAMSWKLHDLAFEACLGNMHRKSPGYALVIALFEFFEPAPFSRFLRPSHSIAVALGLTRGISEPCDTLTSEVLERLEDAFDGELPALIDAGKS